MYMSIKEIVNKIKDGNNLYLMNDENSEIIYFEKNKFFVKDEKMIFEVSDIERFIQKTFYHGLKCTFSENLYNKNLENKD